MQINKVKKYGEFVEITAPVERSVIEVSLKIIEVSLKIIQSMRKACLNVKKSQFKPV